ncbi:MAG: hypothetical protein ACK5C5_00980 [Bacteroidota bacterium]|jgi:hypothetical protein
MIYIPWRINFPPGALGRLASLTCSELWMRFIFGYYDSIIFHGLIEGQELIYLVGRRINVTVMVLSWFSGGGFFKFSGEIRLRDNSISSNLRISSEYVLDGFGGFVAS